MSATKLLFYRLGFVDKTLFFLWVQVGDHISRLEPDLITLCLEVVFFCLDLLDSSVFLELFVLKLSLLIDKRLAFLIILLFFLFLVLLSFIFRLVNLGLLASDSSFGYSSDERGASSNCLLRVHASHQLHTEFFLKHLLKDWRA